MFSSLQIDQGAITRRLKELSCLNKGISFQFEDLRVIKNIFENSDGVVGLLDSVTYKHLIKGCSESQGVSVDVAMGWNGSQTKIQSYANQLCTKDGGLHEAGLIDGLSKAIKEFGGCLSDTDKLSELISDGLHAVVHVNIADPKYANPTIDRLINPEAQDAVSEVLKKLVLEYLNENSKFASSIIEQYISKEVYAVLLKKDIKS